MLLQYSAKLQKFCVPSVHGFVRSIALSAENSLQDTLRYVSSCSTSVLLFLPLCYSFCLCTTLSTSVLLFLSLCYSSYLCTTLPTSVLLFLPTPVLLFLPPCYSFYLCAALSTSVLPFLLLCYSFYYCATLSTSVLLFLPLCYCLWSGWWSLCQVDSFYLSFFYRI